MAQIPTKETRIYYPNPQERQALIPTLMELTKAELTNCARPFLEKMKETQLVADVNGQRCEPQEISELRAPTNKPKPKWAEFLSVVWHPKNFAFCNKLIPKNVQTLIKEAMQNVYVRDDRVNAVMKRTIFKNVGLIRHAYDTNELQDEQLTPYFQSTLVYDNSNALKSLSAFIYLKKALRQAWQPCFFDLENPLKVFPELPEEDGLITYSTEGAFLLQVRMLDELYNKLGFYDNNLKLTSAQMKEVTKVFKLKEFFPNTKGKDLQQLSTSLAATFYIRYCKSLFTWYDENKPPFIPHEKVKEAVRASFDFDAALLSLILPYLTGVKRAYCNDNSMGDLFIQRISDFLLTMPKGQWVSMQQVIQRFNATLSSDNALNLFSPSALGDMKLKNKMTGKLIHLGDVVDNVSRPFIEGVFFLFAALGMLDIAYQVPEKGDISPYSGLRYVRSTPLLRYVLNQDKAYTPPAINQKKLFETDDERLLVRSLGNNNPTESILANMSRQVSPHLYKMTFEDFLNGCNCDEDVEQRITLFKERIVPNPSPKWKDFFTEAPNRCQPFEAMSECSVFQIPKDMPELDRLIHNTPELHTCVFRAENGLLVIKRGAQKKFTDVLRNHGYLL